MSFSPQKMREIIFQLLFSLCNGSENPDEVINLLSKELEVSKKHVFEAYNKVKALLQNLDKIDDEISVISTSYTFDRIHNVEKNILRLGIYELLFDSSIPNKVAIAEGLRLARKFSTPESAAFINAVLDGILKRKEGGIVDEISIQKSLSALEESQNLAENASQNREEP